MEIFEVATNIDLDNETIVEIKTNGLLFISPFEITYILRYTIGFYVNI